MAALVQTITTQQSAPLILQSSTPSASLQGMVSGTPGMSQGVHNARGAAAGYGGQNASSANNTNYRGYQSSAPIAPYAFTSTPVINSSKAKQDPRSVQQAGQNKPNGVDLSLRQRSAAAESISSTSSASSDHFSQPAQVNGAVQNRQQPLLVQPVVPASQPLRPSPDRYRRPNRKAENAAPASSPLAKAPNSAAAAGTVYQQPGRANSTPAVPTAVTLKQSVSTQQASDQFALGTVPAFASYTAQLRSQSADDIHTYQKPGITSLHHNHNRRRSFASFGGTESLQALVDLEARNTRRASLQSFPMNAPPARPMTPPRSAHSDRSQPSNGSQRLAAPHYTRRGSTDSVGSASSGGSGRPSSGKTDRQNSFTGARPTHEISPVNVPPRGSSTAPDAARRVVTPSPLSKPMSMTPDPNTYQEFPQPDSKPTEKASQQFTSKMLPKSNTTQTAADRLAAISIDNKKSLKNRLRRALSFGSAAELRKVAANANHAKATGTEGKAHEELDEESARIARQQEATGLGEGIYSGQGNFFGGSTDNISVSSTASSASIMLRKMGKGMKRSTRSLVGLFRPKSMVGLSTVAASQAAEASSSVAIVNVEAERDVNVNSDPHDQPGGGTGFPKLERASMDRSGSRGRESVRMQSRDGESGRQSIIGSDADRQEVLASLKKGILKRSGSSSPIVRPADSQNVGFTLPAIPSFSPNSPNLGPVSAPVRESDYFTEPSLPAAMTSSSSVPASPRSHPKYGVTFSPRITFHDTWTAGEYDRKGDVATCNRLTPMLAQQIKEELNTFKMEMDVHEESRIYTHFF